MKLVPDLREYEAGILNRLGGFSPLSTKQAPSTEVGSRPQRKGGLMGVFRHKSEDVSPIFCTGFPFLAVCPRLISRPGLTSPPICIMVCIPRPRKTQKSSRETDPHPLRKVQKADSHEW